MRGASLAWAVALALYLLRALSVWQAEADRIRNDRMLSPRRRRGERQLAFFAAVGWPVRDLVELVLRRFVGAPTRAGR